MSVLADIEDIAWLKEQFAFHYCDECEGDWYDHNVIVMNLGDYGSGYRFALCKIADFPGYKVRSRE